MSLEIKELQLDKLKISNLDTNLLIDASTNTLNITSINPIRMPGKTLNLNGTNINLLKQVTAPTNSDFSLIGKGTGGISLNVVLDASGSELSISDTGIATFNHLPQCSSGLTSNPNELLCARNFNFSNNIDWDTELSGTGLTSITYSNQVGKYTKIGNFIFFNANVTVSSFSTNNSGVGAILLKLPLPIPYVTTHTTDISQALTLTYYDNFDVSLSMTDLTIGIAGLGDLTTSNIQTADLYYKKAVTGADTNPIPVTWSMVTQTFRIIYGGAYYLVP